MKPRKREMYRMPWSMNDNPIGWLEITDKCNIYCRGCYRRNLTGHKPLEQIKEELRFFKEWRNCDNISIAGGEPLIHPDILEIVAYIRELGMKPLILTNGVKLADNRPFLLELKRAGTLGFTLHIDSEQQRPHWKGRTEEELCELRLEYARMINDVSGLFVSVGATIYPTNLDKVPYLVRWANEHIDVIHGLVFITFRGAPQDGTYDYFVDGQPIVDIDLGYTIEDDEEIQIMSNDVYAKVKEANPFYETSAYLGGSQTHYAIKWLLNVQFGAKGQMYGSIGAKGMELVQTFYHLFTGRYLAYTTLHKLPKIALLLGAIDRPGLGRTHRNYWKDVLRHPQRLFQPIYTQSIGIIQAPDLLADGRQDMCDSCPDMTVWDGKLIHSCRMDEWRLYGTYVVAQRHTEVSGQGTAPSEIETVKDGELTPAK